MTRRLCLTAFLFLISVTIASATVAVYPEGITFPSQVVGTTGAVQYVTVYNIGANTFTINSDSINQSVFKIVSGTVPYTLAPGQSVTYSIQFTPTAAQTYNANLTFTFTGATAQNVNLTGNGINTSALPTLSSTSINFGNQPLGANGPSQTLTITNNGTSAVKLTSVSITPPFTQTGWKSSTTIQPGAKFSMTLAFMPNVLGAITGEISLTYDVAPAAAASLWGTGTTATNLGMTTYPNLPSGTIAYPYEATLTAAGGTPPYTWSLPSGANLPTGLSLSTAGVISGTIASTVKTGNGSFTVKVTDSSTPPKSVSATQILSLSNSIGANCNNISFNAGDGSGPLVPITDLGTGFYLGAEEGGLYANGSNADTSDHISYGQGLAAGIQPLDSNGNYDPNGSYALVGIGLSVTQDSLDAFVPAAMLDPAKNSHLVVVNGATGGATANALTSLNDNVFWEAMTNDYLPNAGVTANQVVAVWFMDVDGGPSGTFPADMTTLQSQYETVAQDMLTEFPNLQIMYVSSIYYTGFSNGIKTLDPEPYAYESGFAVKNMIQDQLNGNSNLNFNPADGPVLAPWMAWGPYLWANGMLPRSDGMVYTCHDMQSDGTHPNAGARAKVSQQLLNFLKSDPTATPWFLSPTAKKNLSRPIK